MSAAKNTQHYKVYIDELDELDYCESQSNIVIGGMREESPTTINPVAGSGWNERTSQT